MNIGFPLRRPAALAALALSTFAPAVRGQRVELRDGSILVGAWQRADDGTITVSTATGDVTVTATEVDRARTRGELSAALRGLAQRHGRSKSAFAHLELAKVARSYGLTDAMWKHLDVCLDDPDAGDAVRRRVDEMLQTLAPTLPVETQDTDEHVRDLLRLARRAGQAETRSVELALAALDGSEADLRRLARHSVSPARRALAVRALHHRPEIQNRRFALRSAILDAHEDVRTAAADAARDERTTEDAIAYLSPGLVHSNPTIAIRTAEAFARLGDRAAVPLLVRAGPLVASAPRSDAPGGATRGFVAVTTQQSYIRDFDVEVAQASFIADPVTDVVQSGVVLDVTVLASITQRVVRSYRRALKDLTGRDPGADPRAWARIYADTSFEND